MIDYCSILLIVFIGLAISAIVQIYLYKNMTMVSFIHSLIGVDLKNILPKEVTNVPPQSESFKNYQYVNSFSF
jgi:hypothetical protein